MNWYAYCGNNPLGYTDPTGLKKIYAGGGAYIIINEPAPSLAEIANPLTKGVISTNSSGDKTGFDNTTNVAGKYHKGLDMVSGKSTDRVVKAAIDGKVLFAGEDPRGDIWPAYKANATGSGTMKGSGVGYTIMVMGDDGVIIADGHTKSRIKTGDEVVAGEIIGAYVEKGKSGGAHLHLAAVAVRDKDGDIVKDPKRLPIQVIRDILTFSGYTEKEGLGEYKSGDFTIINVEPKIKKEAESSLKCERKIEERLSRCPVA